MSSEEDVSEEEYDLDGDDDYYYDDGYYCDTCDREFDTEDKYYVHISEHTVCGLDGCKFTAHEKIVQKHIEMQHKSGLYDKIKQLQKPEDIDKWIEERKKNYPSKENVELRRKKQEEMMKRGEILAQTNNRFGRRNETRASLPPRNKIGRDKFQKHRNQKKWNQRGVVKTKFKFDDKSDWNGNLPPFRGTTELFDEGGDDDDFSDDEWQPSKLGDENITNERKKHSDNSIKLNNALGALMGAYNSSDYSEDDEEEAQNGQAEKNNLVNASNIQANENARVQSPVPKTEEDDEAPEEVKICRDAEKAPDQVAVEKVDEIVSNVEMSVEETAAKSVSSGKRKRKHLKKRHGKKNDKQKALAKEEDVPSQFERPTKEKNCNFVNRGFKRRRVTLLERLLEKDITHERNVILQCVRYVVNNKFFDKITDVSNTVPNVSETLADCET